MRPMVVFPDPAGPSIAMITLETRRGLQAGDLVRTKGTNLAFGKVTKLKPIDPHALQVEHGMSQRLPEPAHFSLSALAQYHRQPGIAVRAVEHLDLRRLESLPAHDHPLREPPQRLVTGTAPDHDPVFLLDMVAGVHQSTRQLAVIGQQHQPPAVEIEPAHRENARPR